MKNLLLKNKYTKDFMIAIFISIVVFIVYTLYIFTIGRRLTEARDLYLKAEVEYEEGNNEEALEYLDKSLERWEYSRETKVLIQEIQESK